MQGVTLSEYFKNYVKSLISSYKGKRLFITLGISVASGLLGFLLTVYALPWLFSQNSVGNQVYAALTIMLIVMIVIGVISGAAKKNSGYFANIAGGVKLLFRGFRIWALIMAVFGAVAGVFLAPAFAVILVVWLFLDGAQPSGTVLTLAAAVQNSFNNKFRKKHVRNAERTRRDALALAAGVLLGFIVRLILGFAGVM